MSPFWFLDVLVSPFWLVAVLVCRRLTVLHFFAYFTLPCNALMVHAHTVVSILLPTLITEQEH